MKFGGTSVGDASSIERVVEIVWKASRTQKIAVVVSAMSGVTNKLIEAANNARACNLQASSIIFDQLAESHKQAAYELIGSKDDRQRIIQEMQLLLREGTHSCKQAVARRELSPRILDAISALGERLSARLVTAALAERGMVSEAIEATEFIITDLCHGEAVPDMDLTRDRCRARLHPLLTRGVVPVVTGFIGATRDGVLITLGRNSSDYSGAIVGAALNADEVTIWTDVNGILTADPKSTPDAQSIPEMSYDDAWSLVNSGAKVLHPSALRTAMQYRIPLTIRNTFAPSHPGTRITLQSPASSKTSSL